MQQPSRNPALERLDALVGEWTMEAGPPGGEPWPGEARVSFEWLEGRTFLIQRGTVDMPAAPDGVAIIGAGDEPETFRQHYFDSRGVHRIYEMTSSHGFWRLRRGCPVGAPTDVARAALATQCPMGWPPMSMETARGHRSRKNRRRPGRAVKCGS
jgi:hypothetical protein